MNLATILLSLLAEAPNLIRDAEAAVADFKAAGGDAGKAQAVVAGIDHIATNVVPLLSK